MVGVFVDGTREESRTAVREHGRDMGRKRAGSRSHALSKGSFAAL
ncbi:sperm protamine P1 family protein [Burkholderia cenocepacia]|nr:sperm protamine P1 family protein [Burkholderia cenocepacia]RQU22424.1 sperm protamine P1 family protein [Burkholderia cenocepacia]